MYHDCSIISHTKTNTLKYKWMLWPVCRVDKKIIDHFVNRVWNFALWFYTINGLILERGAKKSNHLYAKRMPALNIPEHCGIIPDYSATSWHLFRAGSYNDDVMIIKNVFVLFKYYKILKNYPNLKSFQLFNEFKEFKLFFCITKISKIKPIDKWSVCWSLKISGSKLWENQHINCWLVNSCLVIYCVLVFDTIIFKPFLT